MTLTTEELEDLFKRIRVGMRAGYKTFVLDREEAEEIARRLGFWP